MKALPQLTTLLRWIRSRKKGQTLVEYVIILAVLTVVAVGSFTLLSARIKFIFSDISNILDTAQGS